MTATYVGGMSLGDAMPGVMAPILQAMGDVQAKITACASFSVGITPPSLTANIAAAASILANCTLALSAGIEPPSIDLQFQIIADAVIVLQLQLQIILDFLNLLGAGVHVYAVSAQTDAVGGELTSALVAGVPGGAPSDLANALVLITTIPADWAKIAQVFKTTP